MGIIDSVKQKVSDHHEQQRNSVADTNDHNDGLDTRKSDTSNWVSKGLGGDRADDHGIRAGSLTQADTNSGMSNPKVAEALMKDEDRIGGVGQ